MRGGSTSSTLHSLTGSETVRPVNVDEKEFNTSLVSDVCTRYESCNASALGTPIASIVHVFGLGLMIDFRAV